MKSVLIAIIVLSHLVACDNVAGVLKNERSDSAKATPAATALFGTTRDQSITTDNAYSNLFVDSASLEKFISDNQLNDTMAGLMRGFYNTRNYQYAWFNDSGFTEQGRSFWNLYTYSHTDTGSDKTLQKQMDTLVENDSLKIATTDTSFTHTELSLTKRFVEYATSDTGRLFLKGSTLYQFIPTKKTSVMQLADSMLHKQKDTTALAANAPYKLLREQLARYYDIAQKGGWQPIASVNLPTSKGNSSAAIVNIKKRLLLTGDYSGDTSQVFHDSLEMAIKSFQQRNGFKPTGIINDSLIQVMNVPVEKRLEQIVINMNRMAWMPSAAHTKVIEVNIPEYMLSVHEGNSKVFDMEVIVGNEGANTMMFTGSLNQIVFSPYWNIPPSIVRNEIMPAMNADANYLKKHNMEIVKKGDSLPVIRQVPGPQNSLGKVKFLFPNTYDIFFHDTPAKDLFAQDKRAFSHGCIRLADARKMASYLLKDDKNWTEEKIDQAMNSGKEQFVKLNNPILVMITYFTAWVDENGGLNFRDDVYKHDEELTRRLFLSSASPATTPYYDSLSRPVDTSKRAI